MRTSIWYSFLGVLLTTLVAYAETSDLDVAGATARYEGAKAESDRAAASYETQKRVVYQKQQENYGAIQREQDARNRLLQLQQAISNIQNEIRRLEQSINNAQSQLHSLQSKIGFEQNRLEDIRRRLDQARRNVQRERQQLQLAQAALAAEKAKPKPNPQLVQQFQQRVNQQQNELNQAEQQCSQLEREERSQCDVIARIERDIRSCIDAIQECRRKISDCENQKTSALFAMQQADSDLNKAQGDVQITAYALEGAKNELSRRADIYNRAYALAQQAYAYLQQVIANYEREKGKVVQAAQLAGDRDGGREGSEVAVDAGKAAGGKTAVQEGTATGTKFAQARDDAQGYRKGREQATTPSLAGSYNAGLLLGKALAQEKAKNEDLPRGYNDELNGRLALPASAAPALVDITDQLPTDVGQPGNDLATTELVSVSTPAPQYPIPLDPTPVVPTVGTPSFSVPAVQSIYSNPPCSGLILAEFEGLCRQTYDSNYRNAYQANYSSTFQREFVSSYNQGIKPAFDAAYAVTYPSSSDEGLQRGAKEQGVLNGFAEETPLAKKTQYEAGKTKLITLLAEGNLLVVRQATMEETSGDELFTPGEKVKVKIVVDNYGAKDTTKGSIVFKVTGGLGVGEFKFETRELPSLRGNTRTILTGVTTAKITASVAAQKVNLQGTLERQGTELFAVKDEQTTHYPLEIVDVVLPKSPKLGETVEATVKFKNMTKSKLVETSLLLSTYPKGIKAEEGTVKVPASDPTAVVEAKVKYTPDFWVGENTNSYFIGTSGEGDKVSRQWFPKAVKVDRDAAVLIFDQYGKEIPDGELTVKAGTVVTLFAKMKFNRDYDVPGPFEFRNLGSSNPEVTSAGDSFISTTYPSLWPSFKSDWYRAAYSIPESLKGKQVTVSISMRHGNEYLHIQPVFLNVK